MNLYGPKDYSLVNLKRSFIYANHTAIRLNIKRCIPQEHERDFCASDEDIQEFFEGLEVFLTTPTKFINYDHIEKDKSFDPIESVFEVAYL